MPAVKIRDGETFERAFKRFTKQCEKAGLMSDIKKHQHYEKPSERKKRKLNAAKQAYLERCAESVTVNVEHPDAEYQISPRIKRAYDLINSDACEPEVDADA